MKAMSTLCFFLVFSFSSFTKVHAEHIFKLLHNGLLFEMTVNAIALSPEDTLRVGYRIVNMAHQGIVLNFGDSKVGKIDVQTPYGRTESQVGQRDFPATMQRYIAQHEAIASAFSFPLQAILIIRQEFLDTVSVADGDTLEVTGGIRTNAYGIDMPGLEDIARLRFLQAEGARAGDERYDPLLDINQDDVINFPDFVSIAANYYILNWEKMPSASRFPTKVYIRRMTADVNRDGQVDFSDFVAFANVFGFSIKYENYDARCDMNGDGRIDFQDFLFFLEKYGQL